MKSLLFVFLLFVLTWVDAKLVKGQIRIDSETSEAFLGKFSFSREGKIDFSAHVSPHQPNGKSKNHQASYYDNRPHQLLIALYDDAAWARYNDMIKVGSLCRERVAIATHRHHVRAKRGQSAVPGQAFSFSHTVSQPSSALHMFAIIADCMLEEYSAHPPALDFTVTFTNGGSHLPADEDGMIPMFYFALVLFSALLVFYLQLLRALVAKYQQSHLLVLLLGVALGAQVLALALQLAHLHVYQANGLGLKLRHAGLLLAFDFYSEMLQLLSELTVALTLVALAFGWTLTDYFRMEAVLARKPMLALGAFCGVHLWLQWKGRQFEEDFAHFHDFHHWPGFLLMCMRVAMLLVFALGMALAHGSLPVILNKCPPLAHALVAAGAVARAPDGSLRAVGVATGDARELLGGITTVGCAWFASFPASVLLTFMLPPTARKLPIVAATLIAHLFALVAMVWAALRPDSQFFTVSSLRNLGSVLGGAGKLGKTAID